MNPKLRVALQQKMNTVRHNLHFDCLALRFGSGSTKTLRRNSGHNPPAFVRIGQVAAAVLFYRYLLSKGV